MFIFTLILNCVFLGVLGGTYGPQCKLEDRACTTKNTNEVYKMIVEDESNELDPINIERLDVDLGKIQYSVIDLSTTGFSKCSVKDANLDLDKLEYEVNLYCPEFHASGTYDAHGILIDMPVEGNGEFTVDTKDFDFKILMEISLTTKDNKHYLHIDKFNVEVTALGNLVYDFKNLFNGQINKGEKLLKLINTHSKEVAKVLEEPLFRAKFEKIIAMVNKRLTKIPLERFVILQ